MTAGRWERAVLVDHETERRESFGSSLDSFDEDLDGQDAGSEREWENWEREYGGRDSVLSFDFSADLDRRRASGGHSHGIGSPSDSSPTSTGHYLDHVRDRSVTLSAGPGDFSSETGAPSPTSRSRTKSFTNALPAAIRPFGASSKVSSNSVGGSGDGSRRTRSSTVTNLPGKKMV